MKNEEYCNCVGTSDNNFAGVCTLCGKRKQSFESLPSDYKTVTVEEDGVTAEELLLNIYKSKYPSWKQSETHFDEDELNIILQFAEEHNKRLLQRLSEAEEKVKELEGNERKGVTHRCAYYDLAEKRALTIPVVMWRFCAYKTEKDYESGNHYFIKDFLDHTEMKLFSSDHSAKEKPLFSEYCSMYWKIETNAT
jgi:hypothetical protein